MNGIYPSTQFCGALGTFPIYDVIDNTSNILNNYTTTTSNNLNQYITNVSNEISPVLFDLQDFQLSNPYAIMYRNSGHNNDTVIVERDSNSEILFKNHTLDCYSKIDVNSKLCVYHPLQALPAGYSAGWWDVESRLTESITLSQGLRFDVTNIQMDDLLQWTAIGTAQTTANSALALAGTGNGVASTALAATVVINGIIPTLISSNSLNDINSFYMSSNLLNKQNYINSNSITDILGMYPTSTSLLSILTGYERINYVFISFASYRTDPTNSPPTFFYDLDITKYVKPSLFENTYTTRIFRITTYMDVSWSNNSQFNLSLGGVAYPETLTIYMSDSPLNGLGAPLSNWCNGLIIGKLNNTNMGYWNIIPTNNNYIRFLSKLGYNTYCIIESILI